MPISSKYRFYLDLPDGSTHEVCPINNELKFKWKYNEKLRTWRYELDTKLCFRNTDKHKSFDALYDLERQCGVCHRVDLRIDKFCQDEWRPHWQGYLPFRKGKWNLDQYTADIKPAVDDVFTCITQHWKEKKNLLDIEDRVTIDTLIGEVECQTTSGDVVFEIVDNPPTAQPPQGFGWTQTRKRTIQIVDDQPSEYTFCQIQWCRECLATAPPDPSSWQLENGKYYRAVAIGGTKTKSETETVDIKDDGQGDDFITTTTIITTTCSIIDIEIDNAITLQSALEFLLSDCEKPVCSDFLNINPPGDSPNNHAYTCAAQYLSNVVLFQASDVILTTGLNGVGTNDANATKFEKCFYEMWCDIAERFQMQMWHDKTNDCIRIEHISYRLDGKVFSLVKDTKRFAKCLRGTRCYEYIKSDFPLSETFLDKIETLSPDFNQASIRYAVECSDDDIETQDKEYKQRCTITDVANIYNNEDYVEDLDVLQSMVMVSLDGSGQIMSAPGPITGNINLNGPMSWANVIECYWLDQRPQAFGEMNGTQRPFISTIPQRQQKNIAFCMTCDEWEEFDPNMGIKTQFGIGYADGEISFTDCGGLVEVNLKFPC